MFKKKATKLANDSTNYKKSCAINTNYVSNIYYKDKEKHSLSRSSSGHSNTV